RLSKAAKHVFESGRAKFRGNRVRLTQRSIVLAYHPFPLARIGFARCQVLRIRNADTGRFATIHHQHAHAGLDQRKCCGYPGRPTPDNDHIEFRTLTGRHGDAPTRGATMGTLETGEIARTLRQELPLPTAPCTSRGWTTPRWRGIGAHPQAMPPQAR